MSRVRFIEPASRANTAFHHYVRQWPLMGPVYLGTVLAQRGHDVRVYNENISGSLLEREELFEDLCAADFVGISIMTATANRGYRLADALRARQPRPQIVFGGVHATFCPQEALAHADFVVRGEGEKAIVEIVEGRAAPGIISGAPVEDLDTLPLPDYDLIYDFSRLWEVAGGKDNYYLPLVTSRGCPHQCRYCSVTPLFGRRYRHRSAERVAADIHHLYAQGYRAFFFYDDNFTADRERTREILRDTRSLDIVWNAQTRIDFAWKDPGQRRRCDVELLELMRETGGDVLYVGYETVDDRTASAWRKGYVGAGDLARRCAEDTHLLHEAGLWIHGMFIVGPDHTEHTLQRIVHFSSANRLESVQISALTPFPGTRIFEESKSRLLLNRFPEDWDFYDGVHALYRDTRMGIRNFQEKLIAAHRQFYRASVFNWRRVVKFLQGRQALRRKIALCWRNARLPWTVLDAWERESRAFLNRIAHLDSRCLLPT